MNNKTPKNVSDQTFGAGKASYEYNLLVFRPFSRNLSQQFGLRNIAKKLLNLDPESQKVQ